MPQALCDYFDQEAEKLGRSYTDKQSFKRRLVIWKRYIDRYAPTGGLCFDAGCGDGTLSRLALEKDMRVVGIDLSSQMIQRAGATCSAYRGRALFIHHSLPLNDESYRENVHLVCCSSVLEYVDDLAPVIREFYDVLLPGGMMLVSLPNRRSSLRVAEGAIGRMIPRVRDYLRLQRRQFSLSEARNLFEQTGFIYHTHEFFGLPSLLHRFSLLEKHQFWGTMILLVFSKPATVRRSSISRHLESKTSTAVTPGNPQ